MSDDIKDIPPMIPNRLLIATYKIKQLLDQVREIEEDIHTSDFDKFSKIKNIKEEMIKVSQEIDNIKNEITLTNSYRIN
jgi:hypothetical protein